MSIKPAFWFWIYSGDIQISGRISKSGQILPYGQRIHTRYGKFWTSSSCSTDMVLDQTWVHVFKYLNYALQLKATRVEAVCMGL